MTRFKISRMSNNEKMLLMEIRKILPNNPTDAYIILEKLVEEYRHKSRKGVEEEVRKFKQRK